LLAQEPRKFEDLRAVTGDAKERCRVSGRSLPTKRDAASEKKPRASIQTCTWTFAGGEEIQATIVDDDSVLSYSVGDGVVRDGAWKTIGIMK
jgi:hypothetical protein